MVRGITLGAWVSLLVGTLLMSVVTVHVLAMKLWIERRADVDQKIGVSLIASEISRLISIDFEAQNQTLSAEFVQALIHSRWVRDADLLRISVAAPDATILADTDLRHVGTTAVAAWSTSVQADRLREIRDRDNQKSYVVSVFGRDRRHIANLVFQISPASAHDDLYRALEAMLRLGIPLLLATLVAVVGISLLTCRRWLQGVLVTAGLAAGVRRAESTSAVGDSGPGDAGLTKPLAETLSDLNNAADELQKLAAR